MKKNINQSEQIFIKNKDHLDSIRKGVIPSDNIKKQKRSIYANFLNKVEGKNSLELNRELEKEIKRNIETFDSNLATKRIMELIWVTRYEW